MGLLSLQAPTGWLFVSLAITLGLLGIYSLIPLAYRRSILYARSIMLPYLALLSGSISPRLMGLTGINWLTSFGFGLGLIAAILGLFVLVRSITDFSPSSYRDNSNNVQGNLASAQPYSVISLALFTNAAVEEFYWSFLRGTLWEIFQTIPAITSQAGYWAIWLAALLVLPEISRFNTTLPSRLFKIILLLLTTVLFIYTQNFWLCWLLHALILLLLIP